MQRTKLLLGTLLLGLFLFVLTDSTVKADDSKEIISNSNLVKTLAEKREIKLYGIRQQALNEALATYFVKAINSGDIVGAGVSIVRGDSVILSNGFGKRSVDGIENVDGETLFRLGSISKGFTGVLAANLESEGKINWNDKIVEFIPNFKFGDKINTEKVEIAHLLSHTSGTPYHSFTNLVEAGLSMSTIAGRFDEVQPISEPGLQYSYQNAMFSLSQEIMLKATGKNIQTLLTDKFFKPLGMESISMDHQTLLNSQNVAVPHTKRGSKWKSIPLKNKYYNAIAAGGINASPLDMAKWMRFLLGHNPEVMSKASVEQVFKPFIELSGHSKYYQRWPGHLKSAYGFGWRVHTIKEKEKSSEETIWHHGGSVNSYRNEIALFPGSDLGICVLLNSNSKLAKIVIPDIHAIVKNIYEQDIALPVSL
ncbi:serine hydrolase domain-containing protein [Maribacter sp. ACAM166]|uniref:serine hydrolase domain-containing protein n=1 Tax=Maribacter sp. ACAM166 TaxID=2508996 RepID=UPI0010FE0E3B|nr:serine hydrolase domain-containing protein [Maribacter sp. ACAM166]TLP72797.1 beta-lactamase family protein [Maribacter sp. ACAM166]